MDNMQIYEAVRAVPDSAKRSFDNGRFRGTEINPVWRIKILTEIFGPAGFGWWYKVTSQRADQIGDTVMAIVDLELYVRHPETGEISQPIYGTGGNVLMAKGRASDEGYKMALTDALSVACKALGIGADVYYERDATKYTAGQQPQDGGGRSMSGRYGEGGAQRQAGSGRADVGIGPYGNGGQNMAAGVSGHYGDGGAQRQAPRQPEGPGGQQTLMPGSGQCERCGRVTPAEMLARGRQAYGADLCYDCQRAIRQQQAAAVRRAEQQQARMQG